jgi:hypothetical protein
MSYFNISSVEMGGGNRGSEFTAGEAGFSRQ